MLSIISSLLLSSAPVGWPELLACRTEEIAPGEYIRSCATAPDLLGAVENAHPETEILKTRTVDGDLVAEIVRRGPSGLVLFTYTFDVSSKRVHRVCHSGIPPAGTPLRHVPGAKTTFVDACRSFSLPCHGPAQGSARHLVSYDVRDGRLASPTVRRVAVDFSGEELKTPPPPCRYRPVNERLPIGAEVEVRGETHRVDGEAPLVFESADGRLHLSIDGHRVSFVEPYLTPLRLRITGAATASPSWMKLSEGTEGEGDNEARVALIGSDEVLVESGDRIVVYHRGRVEQGPVCEMTVTLPDSLRAASSGCFGPGRYVRRRKLVRSPDRPR